MATRQRRNLSARIRFEVLKRDRFQCQYCGASSPEALLQVDHVEPASKGGTDDLINLVTSCQKCNSGKSDKRLDDHSACAKQHAQLAELQERREQLELMIQWKNELLGVDENVLESICDHWTKRDPAMPFYVNDWLSSSLVAQMTLEQQGAYLRLLCFCWASQSASIPDDDDQLSRLSGMGEGWLANGCHLVRRGFIPHPTKTGCLTSPRLFELWQERQEWRRKSAEGGRKSGAKRQLEQSKGGSRVVQPKGNSSSLSSSSIDLPTEDRSSNSSGAQPNGRKRRKPKRFVRPTVDEVRAYCEERANGIDAQTFIDHHDRVGWVVGKNKTPMKDWRATVRTWENTRKQSRGQKDLLAPIKAMAGKVDLDEEIGVSAMHGGSVGGNAKGNS